MAGADWTLRGEPKFETGISKGVFYYGEVIGRPWVGLVSVEETITQSSPTPIYLDGEKRYNKPKPRDYKAKVKAFSTPEGFEDAMGHVEIVPGVTITDQPRKEFAFSYQTNVGTDGRRIHLVYNVVATPTKKSYITLDDSPEAPVQEWTITATPPRGTTHRPSAHLIIDSTRMPDYIFEAVEDVIYGNDSSIPFMPGQDYIRNIVGNPLIEPLKEPI